MWAILKFDKKKIELLKSDFKKKAGKDTTFYTPKLIIQKYLKNKLDGQEINLLGDYMFCYNKNFEKKNFLNTLQFSRGLKYFLEGHSESQKDIISFIKKCKDSENEKGYISINFFELVKNSKYKFSSGPFSGKIFEIINLQKNKIDILLGKIKTSIKKKEFLFRPI